MTAAPGPTPSPRRLPTRSGMGPRVAMLVYNDAHNDARVLKEATALRQAGATVRVFAVARNQAGHAAGEAVAGEGVDLTRVEEFSLQRVAPALARVRDLVLGGGRGRGGQCRPRAVARCAPDDAPASPGAGPAGGAPRPAPVPATTPPAPATASAGLPAQVSRLAADAAMRVYKTVALGDYWRRTISAVIAWGPDVVHANDGNTLAPALRVCDRTGARLVYDSHELWMHRNVRTDRPLAPHVEAAIEKAGIARASAVITVSPSIVDWLADHYGMERPPFLVRNVPEAGPAPDAARGRLRELADLAPADRVIAYGGRITTSRGLEETLEALAHLDPGVHLVMLGYGEPDYLDALSTRARELGVEQRVHRVGPVAPHEVADALADADVSVVHVRPTCLSYRFALPNKLFESIRGGLPVAAADLPDIREVVTTLGVGEVFAGEDPRDMARTISAILDDPSRYRRAALAAAESLTWEHETVALIDAYRLALMGERA